LGRHDWRWTPAGKPTEARPVGRDEDRHKTRSVFDRDDITSEEDLAGSIAQAASACGGNFWDNRRIECGGAARAHR